MDDYWQTNHKLQASKPHRIEPLDWQLEVFAPDDPNLPASRGCTRYVEPDPDQTPEAGTNIRPLRFYSIAANGR